MSARSVAIIGGGPSGLTAAIYLARAGLAPVVYLGVEQPGGSLTTTTEVENYPGFPAGITGPELMENLQAQAERFGADVQYDTVLEADLEPNVKILTTESSGQQFFDAVVLSMGAEHRRLGLPRERELSGKGVSYCATCDGVFFAGKDVGVVGGGDTACEEALFLTRFARTVTLFVRGTALRASKIMADRVTAHPGITIEYKNEIVGLETDSDYEREPEDGPATGSLLNVLARRTDLEVTETRALQGLFVAIGHTPRSELVDGQVHTDMAGYVMVSSPTTQTSFTGVFACGDLVDRRYRQAITAAGTGAAAGIDAERYLAGLDTTELAAA